MTPGGRREARERRRRGWSEEEEEEKEEEEGRSRRRREWMRRCEGDKGTEPSVKTDGMDLLEKYRRKKKTQEEKTGENVKEILEEINKNLSLRSYISSVLPL